MRSRTDGIWWGTAVLAWPRADDLDRVIDTQHVGLAAYVRGLLSGS